MNRFSPWCCHPVSSLLFVLASLTLTTHAQLDTSGTGMSDIWQRHFNNGNLFDPQNPNHAPEADPDGDGWTNIQESIAGTNPFSGKPPEGIVAASISLLKNQEEAPSLEHPNGRLIDIAILSWVTLPGKEYTLQYSPDLAANSWLAVDVPYPGSGLPVAVGITLTDPTGEAPEKLFWRVKVDDPKNDTDSDGLTDHEEFLLGSNPDNPFSTATGIPDLWIAQKFGHIANIFQIFDPNMIIALGGPNPIESLLSGTDPNTPSNGTLPQWTAISTCDTGGHNPLNVPQRQRTVTIPANTSAIIAVVAASAEFSEWTDPASSQEYNDILQWDIDVASTHHNFTVEGNVNVNSLHASWLLAREHNQVLPGLVNVAHFVAWRPIHAPAMEDLTVTITLNAANVGDNRLASELAVGILPLGVYDNILATGNDDLAKTAAPADQGYQQDIWIMAPQQGGTHPKENLTHFSLSALGQLGATLHCANATPVPAALPLDGESHNILWRGLTGDGVEDQAPVEIQLGTHPQRYPLGVQAKSMKYRTVKVKAIRVQHGNGRAFPDEEALDFNVLETKVNEYLAYQLNAWLDFDLDTETFNYDKSIEFNMVDNKPEDPDDPDDYLDAHNIVNDPRFQAGEDYDLVVIFIDDINFKHGITFINGIAPILLLENMELAQNVCFVLVRAREADLRDINEIAFTTAHEIGHLLVGLGHPDEGGGIAPFPSLTLAEHQLRLMCSGENRLIGFSRLLVKTEWDAAEARLKELVDGEEEEE